MGKIINIIGQKFGKLTVIEEAGWHIQPSGQRKRLVKCKCDCGKETIVQITNLIRKKVRSCGNCNEIHIGDKFGKLTVISKANNYVSPSGNISSCWFCKCECGNTKIVRGYYLLSGHTKSCGCLVKSTAIITNTKHGLSDSRIYNEHRNMKKRCYNPNSDDYYRYGGRGITICDEWLDEDNGFMNFYNWSMSHGYRDDLTIDRINVNGNYEPSNCRWVPNIIQANNTRSNNYIEYDGNIFTLINWSRALGQGDSKLYARLYNNWPIHEVLRGKTDNLDSVNAICFIDEYGMPVPQDKVSEDNFVN